MSFHFQGLPLAIYTLDLQFDIQQHSRAANIILEHSSWTTSDLRPLQVLREMEYHLRHDAHGCHVRTNLFLNVSGLLIAFSCCSAKLSTP